MINPQKSKEKNGQKLTAAINNSPVRIVVETLDGEEFSFKKAYFVGGRAAEIKLLINGNSVINKTCNRVLELEDETKGLQKEIDELEDCKKELEEWQDEFPHDTPEALKKAWDAIEESIRQFADVAGMNLVANDADNIDRLRKSFELRLAELRDADEIIGELKIKLAKIEKEAKV